MKTKMKRNVFYIFLAFLFLSACIWTSPVSGPSTASASPPGTAPIPATSVAAEQTVTPTIVAGSFADFQFFARELAAALQDRDPSFFERYVAPSTWTCLGDEALGVCKGAPADTTLEGIPVTQDWATYEMYSKENYREMWQTRFAGHRLLKLAAVAHSFGSNPFMPMATESSLAIVGVAENDDPASIQEVRVLFFEHFETTWYLRGELVAAENAEVWLNNTCDRCYDTWAAWSQ